MNKGEKFSGLNKQISRYLPAWHGLRLATEILGPSLSSESRDAAQKFQKSIGTKLDLILSSAQKEKDGEDLPLTGKAFEEWEKSRGR